MTREGLAQGTLLVRGNAHAHDGGRFRPRGQLRQRQLAEIKKAIAAHRSRLPLVLATHGSVIGDLTGLNIRMGELVVLRRAADGSHAVGGRRYLN